MSKLAIALYGALVAFSSFRAYGIENSAAVKVTQLLKTASSWDNAPIAYPDGVAEITGLLIEIAPGGETGWHEHPVPSFGIVLQGQLEVTLTSGLVKRLKAGEALAEVINTEHNGRNVGGEPVKLVVFYVGAAGQPLTVQRPHPERTIRRRQSFETRAGEME